MLNVEVPIQELKGKISVIDYILVNEGMYKHYDPMEIDEDKLLYDLSDLVYIYENVVIPNGKPKFKNRKVEEIKYYRVKDNQLKEKFIWQLEGSVERAMEGEDSTVLRV